MCRRLWFVLLQDDTLGGYHVPAGTWVSIAPGAMHRLGQFYQDPDDFKPERWLGDTKVGAADFNTFVHFKHSNESSPISI